MRLWSFQPVEVADQLRAGQSFRCDPSLAECYNLDDEFRNAYHWLVGEMDARMERPAGVELPIWAWRRSYGREAKPDLRRMAFNSAEHRESALLELEVPEELVLLSGFVSWHSVLNDFPERSDSEWESDPDRVFSEEEKIASWQRIFETAQTEDFVQATFWEILPDYLRSVRYPPGVARSISGKRALVDQRAL